MLWTDSYFHIFSSVTWEMCDFNIQVSAWKAKWDPARIPHRGIRNTKWDYVVELREEAVRLHLTEACSCSKVGHKKWTPAQATKEKTYSREYIKIESFYAAKDTINRLKWETIFTTHVFDKGLIPRMYIELQLNNEETNNWM